MNGQDETTFDPRIADWLEGDPNEAPDQARQIVLAAFPSIKQRHASRLPRKFTVTALPRLALGAAAIVVVVLAGVFLVRPPTSGTGTGGPTPSPSALPSATPATPSSVRFTSPLYGYSVQMPPSWTVAPATARWPGSFQLGEDPTYSDSFLLEGSPDGASVSVKAHAIPTGTTAAAWLANWERQFEVGGHCFGSATPWTDASVAGVPARRLQWRCDSGSTANYDVYSLVSGGTGYVISGTPAMVEVVVQSFQAP